MRRPAAVPARTRLAVAAAVGAVAGAAVAFFVPWEAAPLTGWAAAAGVYVSWVWASVGTFDAASTRAHATREEPSRAEAELTLLIASVASLAAVALVIARAHGEKGAGKFLLGGLALVSVLLSWAAIHTVFALRYASLYYAGEPGGIDFHDDHPPRYTDFAYLAFTVGMTFQVSDTELNAGAIRATVLRHALLAYLFGAVILASVINLFVGLSQ
jgi:uncharacterized membrane protein